MSQLACKWIKHANYYPIKSTKFIKMYDHATANQAVQFQKLDKAQILRQREFWESWAIGDSSSKHKNDVLTD